MFRISFLVLAAFLSVFAHSGKADSLVLISQSGGEYAYGIQLDANHGIVFAPGDSITLTGLADVTAASVLPNLGVLFTNVVTTPTSATMVAGSGIVEDPLPVSHILSAVSVNSTALSIGLVTYEIQTVGVRIIGTVTGPGSVGPGARLLALATGGMLALIGWRSKRPSAAPYQS